MLSLLKTAPISRRTALGLLSASATTGWLRDRTDDSAGQTPLPEVVFEWFGAWSSSSPPAAIAALYDLEGCYEDVPSGASMLAPEIEPFLASMLNGLGNVTRHMRGSFAAGDSAVVEQLIRATNQGRFASEPMGAEYQVYAVTVFKIAGDRLLRTTDYYDAASIVSQLRSATRISWA